MFYLTGGWLQGNQLFIMILLTLLTMGIIFLVPKLPKLGKLLPSPLVSIIIISFLVIMFRIDTLTVGDLASVSGGLPEFGIPSVPFNFETLLIVLPFSLTLAGIGLIESLLTLTLIDEITETKGKPNKECFGQGLSNVTCGFFGAMGGCAMIGQSMINISSGGRGRLSGIVAAVSLLCFILFFSKWIEMIPIAALTGIMMMVVIGTFAWASIKIINKVPKEDAFVIILVTFVTVWQDLAIAVVVGVIFSALSYSWKSSSFINLEKKETISKDESIYILKGSLFFGSINKFKNLMNPINLKKKLLI
jgi:Sulfate permease and related transporters (MFS superfamily)